MIHSAVLLWARRGVGGDQGPGSSGSRSATCSQIAVRLRHPARIIPVTARDRTAVRQWRTAPVPRIGHVPKDTGQRDRAVVVEDDIGGAPPSAARMAKAPPIVPAGPRRTRTDTPTTPDIRPPVVDFADLLGSGVIHQLEV